MSRSYRKTPIFGITTARSEKEDKKSWHSAMRHRERQELHQMTDQDAHMTVDRRQVSNPWSMAKDGRIYWDEKSQMAVARGRAQAANDVKAVPRALHKFMGK